MKRSVTYTDGAGIKKRAYYVPISSAGCDGCIGDGKNNPICSALPVCSSNNVHIGLKFLPATKQNIALAVAQKLEG